jgi:hypothetical protein
LTSSCHERRSLLITCQAAAGLLQTQRITGETWRVTVPISVVWPLSTTAGVTAGSYYEITALWNDNECKRAIAPRGLEENALSAPDEDTVGSKVIVNAPVQGSTGLPFGVKPDAVKLSICGSRSVGCLHGSCAQRHRTDCGKQSKRFHGSYCPPMRSHSRRACARRLVATQLA